MEELMNENEEIKNQVEEIEKLVEDDNVCLFSLFHVGGCKRNGEKTSY